MSTSIKRGEGYTATEQALAGFADRSFLRLWSYPNTFNDRTKSSTGSGQEIADLMVVFGPHVLIFSDKDIAWQEDKPTGLAWSRWYKRAVASSIGQLEGAERWIDKHPDRIFVDQMCEQRLPIALPPERKANHPSDSSCERRQHRKPKILRAYARDIHATALIERCEPC